jgi:hypothetical protein
MRLTPFPPSRRRLACAVTILGVCALALAADPPADEDGPPQPKTFTFSKPDATLGAVAAEFKKQTGFEIDLSRADSSRALKVNAQKVSFWPALEQIAKEADHRLALQEQGRKVLLIGNDATYRELPTSFDGIFRLACKRVLAQVDLENDQAYCDVELSLHWEPTFYAFLVENPGKSVTAIDNADKELSVDEGGGRLAVQGGGTGLRVRLRDVPRSAKTVKRLEGSFTVVGTPRALDFEFGKLASKKQEEVKKNDVTAQLSFTAGEDLWTATVQLEYPAGGPELESFEASAWTADIEAALVSLDGKKRLPYNGGYELISATAQKAAVRYRFVDEENQKLGKPTDWKLVVKAPSKLIEVPVKFKLENIPLP